MKGIQVKESQNGQNAACNTQKSIWFVSADDDSCVSAGAKKKEPPLGISCAYIFVSHTVHRRQELKFVIRIRKAANELLCTVTTTTTTKTPRRRWKGIARAVWQKRSRSCVYRRMRIDVCNRIKKNVEYREKREQSRQTKRNIVAPLRLSSTLTPRELRSFHYICYSSFSVFRLISRSARRGFLFWARCCSRIDRR